MDISKNGHAAILKVITSKVMVGNILHLAKLMSVNRCENYLNCLIKYLEGKWLYLGKLEWQFKCSVAFHCRTQEWPTIFVIAVACHGLHGHKHLQDFHEKNWVTQVKDGREQDRSKDCSEKKNGLHHSTSSSWEECNKVSTPQNGKGPSHNWWQKLLGNKAKAKGMMCMLFWAWSYKERLPRALVQAVDTEHR